MSNMNISHPADVVDWVEVCDLAKINPNTGVCALIDDQQIAIFRVGSEQRVYALSNQDPFSQAYVISRGILGDLQYERVVASPMYKQHFSLATGRCLEDPQYRLQVFPSKVEQGKVWICSQAQKTYVAQPVVPVEQLKLVMIGHSLLGLRCLNDLLQLAPDHYQISVIAAEPYANDDWMQMLAQLSGERLDPQLHSADLAQHIQLISEAVIKIDRSAKQVLTSSGQRIDYDRLILASGARPILPLLDGLDLHGVFSLSNITDVQAILHEAVAQQQACIIGSSVLAVAAADALRQQGMQVTLLCSGHALLEQYLDACSSLLLQQRLQQQGIKLHFAVQIDALRGEHGQLKQLYLTDGRCLSTEMAVFAHDVCPDTALAQQAGLQCRRGVLVNDTMQSFDPSIYAIGDCIEHRGQSEAVLQPRWGQALTCASHLAERGSFSYQVACRVVQFNLMGCPVFSAGDIAPVEDYEDIILNDEKRQIYKRIIIQHDRVIGAVLLGDLDDADWYVTLIEKRTQIGDIRHKLLFGRDFALRKAG